ncbi:MAG: hypothetical protein ABR559_01830 [Gemmatimonadota bacterium]
MDGYGEAPRPTGLVRLHGAGATGEGENVDWTPADQAAFGAVCDRRIAPGATTIGGLSNALLSAGVHRYHRAAIESAALDLALRQRDTNLFVLAGRAAEPVRFCHSTGRHADPRPEIAALVGKWSDARVKLDVHAEGWADDIWTALAATGRVVVVDFKREGEAAQLALAHRHLPAAWIEDPPLAATGAPSDAPWRTRIALDGYVQRAADLASPPFAPAAVNVKIPRVGGPLEALRCLEAARIQHRATYFGGMFELGAGRRQGQVLASLFTAGAWNDLAPLDPANSAASPLTIPAAFSGFGFPAPSGRG